MPGKFINKFLSYSFPESINTFWFKGDIGSKPLLIDIFIGSLEKFLPKVKRLLWIFHLEIHSDQL